MGRDEPDVASPHAAGRHEPLAAEDSTRAGPADRRSRRHADDRSRRARRELAPLARRACPPNAPPWSRPTPMAAASSRSRRRSRTPAARPSSWPIWPKRGGCARSRRRAAIYVLDGLLPAPRGASRINARPVIGSLTELAEWDALRRRQRLARRRGDPRRYRHEPARHSRRGSGRARAAPAAGEPRHHAADEPSRLRRDARASAERKQIELFREIRVLSAAPRLARQFVRHLPRRSCALRPGAAGRRALRRQSDAGQPNPMRRGRAARRASFRSRESRRARPSATAASGPPSAPARLARSSRSATPTAIRARPARPSRAAAAK